MNKKSFTLIETILALIIVSLIISGFSKLLINLNNNTYEQLNIIQNQINNKKSLSNNDNFTFVKH